MRLAASRIQGINPFVRTMAVAAPMALSMCQGAPARAPQPSAAISAVQPMHEEGPSPAPSENPEAPKPSLVPTTLTLIRTGNVFLAYVSVPDDGSVRDLEDPKSVFTYSPVAGRWSVVPGCERAFSCDATAVIRANPGGLRIKAEFSADGYANCASAEHPVLPSAP